MNSELAIDGGRPVRGYPFPPWPHYEDDAISAATQVLKSGCVNETIAAALSPRTKGIIVVHLAGWPCDMDPIMNLARETVSHDTRIDDFVTAAPSANISGSVQIGEGCDLGTGSAVIQGIEIGKWTVVGAGAVVVSSLPANVTAVGVPAKVIKERPDGWHEQ
jgi:hypothetical protein